MAAKVATKKVPRGGNGWFPEAAAVLQRIQSGASSDDRVVRAWKALRGRWQRLAKELRRESAALSREVQRQFEKRLDQARAQAETFVRPFEKNAREVMQTLRKRTERLETAARRRVQRVLVDELELAPRKDVEQLRQRVAELEKQLNRLAKQRKEAAHGSSVAAATAA